MKGQWRTGWYSIVLFFHEFSGTSKGGKEKMLRTDLPKIITDTVPGPKSQALIDRRKAATPGAIGYLRMSGKICLRGVGKAFKCIDPEKGTACVRCHGGAAWRICRFRHGKSGQTHGK